MNLIKSKFTSNKCLYEAEDRFAYSFTKLYQKVTLNQLENQSNLSAYFLTICRNSYIIDAQRNKVKSYENLPEYKLDYNFEKNDENEVSNLTEKLINQLPKQLKTISEKIYLEDKDHKEIAEELGINYQNVRKYQYKAIKILKSKTPNHYREYIGNAA